jgi:hypothetical protein
VGKDNLVILLVIIVVVALLFFMLTMKKTSAASLVKQPAQTNATTKGLLDYLFGNTSGNTVPSGSTYAGVAGDNAPAGTITTDYASYAPGTTELQIVQNEGAQDLVGNDIALAENFT